MFCSAGDHLSWFTGVRVNKECVHECGGTRWTRECNKKWITSLMQFVTETFGKRSLLQALLRVSSRVLLPRIWETCCALRVEYRKSGTGHGDASTLNKRVRVTCKARLCASTRIHKFLYVVCLVNSIQSSSTRNPRRNVAWAQRKATALQQKNIWVCAQVLFWYIIEMRYPKKHACNSCNRNRDFEQHRSSLVSRHAQKYLHDESRQTNGNTRTPGATPMQTRRTMLPRSGKRKSALYEQGVQVRKVKRVLFSNALASCEHATCKSPRGSQRWRRCKKCCVRTCERIIATGAWEW